MTISIARHVKPMSAFILRVSHILPPKMRPLIDQELCVVVVRKDGTFCDIAPVEFEDCGSTLGLANFAMAARRSVTWFMQARVDKARKRPVERASTYSTLMELRGVSWCILALVELALSVRCREWVVDASAVYRRWS